MLDENLVKFDNPVGPNKCAVKKIVGNQIKMLDRINELAGQHYNNIFINFTKSNLGNLSYYR